MFVFGVIAYILPLQKASEDSDTAELHAQISELNEKFCISQQAVRESKAEAEQSKAEVSGGLSPSFWSPNMSRNFLLIHS